MPGGTNRMTIERGREPSPSPPDQRAHLTNLYVMLRVRPTVISRLQLPVVISNGGRARAASLRQVEQSFHGATFLLRDKNSSGERGSGKEEGREGELIRLNCTCNVARRRIIPRGEGGRGRTSPEGAARELCGGFFLPSVRPFASVLPSFHFQSSKLNEVFLK